MSTMRVTSADISVVLAVGAALAVPIVIGGAAGSDVPGVGVDADGVDVIRAGPFGSGPERRTSPRAPFGGPLAFAARPRGEERARSTTAPVRVSRSGVRRNRPTEAGSVGSTPAAPVNSGTAPPQPAPAPSPASPAGPSPPSPPSPSSRAAATPAPPAPPLIPPLPPIVSPPPPSPPPPTPPPPPPPVVLPPVPPLPPLPPLPPVDLPDLPVLPLP
jgi:hypothetical protein